MTAQETIVSVTRTTLRAQAVETLRRAISNGILAPGERVPEVETANRLAISRGTLREALRTLHDEGLLVAESRGRLSVRRMGAGELADVFRVRGALEALAARSIAEREERATICAELRRLARAMDQEASEPFDERVSADIEFHRALCAFSENETLLRSWVALEGMIRFCITHAGHERANLNVKADAHIALVDVIEHDGPDAADRAIAEHMAAAVGILTEERSATAAGLSASA